LLTLFQRGNILSFGKPTFKEYYVKKWIVLFLFLSIPLFGFCEAPKLTLEAASEKPIITPEIVAQVIATLTAKFGDAEKERISMGVTQAGAFWTKEDGNPADFETFCLENFASDPKILKDTFQRFEKNFESLLGHFNWITRDLKEPLDVDIGEKLPVDDLFAKLSPEDHLQEDLFKLKIAFYILLNFPQTTLEEKLKEGPKWDREKWAWTRLCDFFPARVPAEISQKINAAEMEAESYVNDYNIFAKYLITPDKKTLFTDDLKLISHWGLRDELKGQYNQSGGLERQEILFKTMERIIDQTIPKAVINKPIYWDPFSNIVYEKSGDQFKSLPSEPEGDKRYEKLITNFKAQTLADRFYPKYPRYIDRKFNLERQITEQQAEKLLIDVLSSDVMIQIGEIMKKRLGRSLRPFDIWYPGFKPGGSISEQEITEKVKQKYPNLAAFEKDVPNILVSLGFTPEKARFISDRIVIDPARGGGHAMRTRMHSDKSRLRTRVPKDGMDYQGFNTAMHELGHNVEQTFSFFDMDHYMLTGVPNTACTECFAFIFQYRDLDILGIKGTDPKEADFRTIHLFLETFEIAGVGLVDLRVWRYLYEHPDATPAQLKEKVIEIAKDVWNSYFAPVFKIKDSPILAIYSHMIAYPLYLADYPVGGIIQFQIEDFLKGKSLGTEMERICKQGCLTPKQWMEGAVGSDLSAEPLIKATREALNRVQ